MQMLRAYPISEIFGPVRQGEGPDAGLSVNFVRVAGCDYDCLLCDTKYAVNPSYPGWAKTDMTAEEIAIALGNLGGFAKTIVFSGGNPGLFVDYPLLDSLAVKGWKCVMETQGTKINEAVLRSASLNRLVISPKPPSMGMADRSEKDQESVRKMFRTRKDLYLPVTLKFVAFDIDDLAWIRRYIQFMHMKFEDNELFLSVGSPIEPLTSLEGTRTIILKRYELLIRDTADDSILSQCKIIPQLHTLIYGQKRGV